MFIEAWGSPGTGEGEFDFVRPDGLSYGDVAFAPDGSFYVVESGNQRVQRFDADRQFVTMWGSKGEADGQFIDPFGAAVAPDGNVYVIDDRRDVIQVFDPDGAFLFAFGDEASGAGQLNDTGGIDIAPRRHGLRGRLRQQPRGQVRRGRHVPDRVGQRR